MTVIIKERIEALLRPICAFVQTCIDFAEKYSAVLFWGGAILYRLLLDAVYIWAASPQYSYGGLVFTPVSWKYILSWGLYLVLFWRMPRRERDTSVFLLHLQFAYTVTPLLSFYALGNGSTCYMLMVCVCVFVQTLILCRPASRAQAVHIVGIKNYITVMLGILVIFGLAIPIFYNGFEGLKAFDYDYIYEMRASAEYPAGFGYIFTWLQRVIIPFAAICFLDRKKYGWLIASVLTQTVFFMESGAKFTLLILVPVIAIYFLSKSGHLIKLLYTGLSGVFLIVIVCYLLDEAGTLSTLGHQLNALIFIRAVFIPAEIKFDYYECFSVFPKVYFGEGLIGRMLGLTYPYAGSTGQVVYAYTGGEFLAANSNTGYLGDAYAQMGFVGMLLMSLLLAALFRGIQSYDSKENYSILTAMFSVFVIILNDGALFTTLLTGGMLIAFMLVVIYFGESKRGDVHGI